VVLAGFRKNSSTAWRISFLPRATRILLIEEAAWHPTIWLPTRSKKQVGRLAAVSKYQCAIVM